MAVNIFDPIYLDAAVEAVPLVPSLFKTTFFGGNRERILPTIDVKVDFKRGARKLAAFVNPTGTAPVVHKAGYKTESFETPLVGNKDVTTIQDKLRRLPGELLMNSGITPDQRGMRMLIEELTNLEDMIRRREEWMCVQSMMAGKIPVIGENVNYEISFGFSNSVVLVEKWDADGATCDPTKDLDDLCRSCRKNGYRNPNVVIMEASAYDAFEQRCIALGKLDQKNFLNLEIKPSIVMEGVTFMGKLLKPNLEIYTYDDWYVDDWSSSVAKTKPLMPKGKIMVGSTASDFRMYYGVLGGVNAAGDDIALKEGRRFAESWVQHEPAARFLKTTTRPLPAPVEVDSWAVAEVSDTTEG